MERTRSFQRGWAALTCGFILLVFPPNSGAQITARPTIRELSPNSAVAGTSDLMLTIEGSGFVSPAPAGALSALPGDGSQVQWNGTLLKTIFVSTTKLTAVVPAGMMLGSATVTVMVVNPGQVVSNASIFIVTVGAAKAPSLAITTTPPLLPEGTTEKDYALRFPPRVANR